MKRFLSAALLLWLCCAGITSCTSLRGITYTPLLRAPHAVVRPSGLYAAPDSAQYTGIWLRPVGSVVVVGYTGRWAVIRFEGSRYFALIDGLSEYPLEYYAYYNINPYYGGSGPAHDVHTGPRGGQYYINGNGNKSYITPQSTIDYQSIQTGPRGGQYYINDNGRKTYIKR